MLANVIPTWAGICFQREGENGGDLVCMGARVKYPHLVWLPDFPCSVCILFLILFPLLPFSFVCLYQVYHYVLMHIKSLLAMRILYSLF